MNKDVKVQWEKAPKGTTQVCPSSTLENTGLPPNFRCWEKVEGGKTYEWGGLSWVERLPFEHTGSRIQKPLSIKKTIKKFEEAIKEAKNKNTVLVGEVNTLADKLNNILTSLEKPSRYKRATEYQTPKDEGYINWSEAPKGTTQIFTSSNFPINLDTGLPHHSVQWEKEEGGLLYEYKEYERVWERTKRYTRASAYKAILKPTKVERIKALKEEVQHRNVDNFRLLRTKDKYSNILQKVETAFCP